MSSGLRANQPRTASARFGAYSRPHAQHAPGHGSRARRPSWPRVPAEPIGQLLPHERGVLSGRGLGRVEERRDRRPTSPSAESSRPRDGARSAACCAKSSRPRITMKAFASCGCFVGGPIARRLVETEVQGEERRDQVVPEGRRRARATQLGRSASASSSRNVCWGLRPEATKRRARRIVAVCGLDADGAALLHQDPLRLDARAGRLRPLSSTAADEGAGRAPPTRRGTSGPCRARPGASGCGGRSPGSAGRPRAGR